MNNVFSYMRQRQPGEAGAVFFRFARALYVRRALLLVLALPFDLAWLLLDACASHIRKKQPGRLLFVAAPPPAWVAELSRTGAGWIGAPNLLALVLRYGGLYIPASPLYVLLTVALFLPIRWQGEIGNVAVRMFARQLRLAAIDGGSLIHHSDALPMGRAATLAARSLGLTTVCIQHGIFHRDSDIAERDGSLSAINVVRSPLDSELIAEAAPASKFLLEPDFFIPQLNAASELSVPKRVTLLGEGWHQCDVAFGRRYLERLRQLESLLLEAGLEVVFRPHPCERGQAADFGFARLDVGPLDACLVQSAIVIGYSSTVLHEAASVGVRAALIDVDGVFNPSMDRNDIALMGIRNAIDVQAMIAKDRAERPTTAELRTRQREAAMRVLSAILENMHSIR
jgi:hypothetical protein